MTPVGMSTTAWRVRTTVAPAMAPAAAAVAPFTKACTCGLARWRTNQRPWADEEHGDLGSGHGCHHADHERERPEAAVAPVGEPGQLPRGDCDDGHDRGGDPVEEGLHDRQPLVVDVESSHAQDEQER